MAGIAVHEFDIAQAQLGGAAASLVQHLLGVVQRHHRVETGRQLSQETAVAGAYLQRQAARGQRSFA